MHRMAVGRCSKPHGDKSEKTGADDDETPPRTTARGPWETTPGPDAGKRGRNDGELGSLHRSCTNSSPPHRLTTRSVTWSRATIKRRSEEHTSELQSRGHLVCRLLLEKKKENDQISKTPSHRIKT